MTSKHQQCDCQYPNQLLRPSGNLFQPWPTPPEPTPSDRGLKAQAPTQPFRLVIRRDPVTIMTSHRLKVFETGKVALCSFAALKHVRFPILSEQL